MITIDRTNYNALIDDDGTNTKGTPWSKNQVKIVLMDPIDGALAKVMDPLSFGAHVFTAAGAGVNSLSVRNTQAGTGNSAALYVGNDADAGLTIVQSFASNYTASGYAQPNGSLLYAGGAGGLSIIAAAAAGAIRFYSGGASERLRIDQNGGFTFNGPGNVTIAGALSVGSSGLGSFTLRNSLNGTTARTDVFIGNDANANLLDIATYASGYTATAGFDLPNGTLFYHAGGGGMSFYTANGGASINFWTGGAKRLSVTGPGEVVINELNPVSVAQVFVGADNSSHIVVYGAANDSATQTIYFLACYNSSRGLAGAVHQTGATTVAFETTSDARLKIDQGRATNLEALRGVLVHDFRWKADDRWDRGVFAQEAAVVFPRAVSEGTDETTESGDLAHPWMTDYSKFVPDLIAGWQQHDAAIAQLRAELAALKG